MSPKKSGTTINIPLFFLEYDFLGKYKKESDPRTRIRLLGLHHIQSGKTFTEVARMLLVGHKTVSEWLVRFISEGIAGLTDKPGRGRKPKLSAEEVLNLKKTVLRQIEEREGGRLKGTEIVKILKERFGADYTLSGVYDLLKRLNIVWITVRSKHPKANPEKQKDFKDNFSAKAEEALPDDIELKNVDIWFQDEARIGMQGTVTRVWAEKGTRPRLIQQRQFLSTYIFGAFSPENDEACGLILPKSDTAAMEIHLKEISDMVAEERHALIVLDGAAWHTTEKLECPENVSLLTLPAYSPELNPAEQVWQQMRQDSLSNRCFF